MKNHSKYLLLVHLVFVCKYRKGLVGKLSNFIKNEIYGISKKYRYEIIEMEVDEDHIHILISYEPKVSVLDIVRNLKQQTTYYLWKKHFGVMDIFLALQEMLVVMLLENI